MRTAFDNAYEIVMSDELRISRAMSAAKNDMGGVSMPASSTAMRRNATIDHKMFTAYFLIYMR